MIPSAATSDCPEHSLRRARVEAARIAETFGPQGDLGDETAPELPLPTVTGELGIAIRRVRTDAPMPSFIDLDGYQNVRTLIEDGYAYLGAVDIACHGRPLSTDRIVQVIAQHVGQALIVPPYLEQQARATAGTDAFEVLRSTRPESEAIATAAERRPGAPTPASLRRRHRDRSGIDRHQHPRSPVDAGEVLAFSPSRHRAPRHRSHRR